MYIVRPDSYSLTDENRVKQDKIIQKYVDKFNHKLKEGLQQGKTQIKVSCPFSLLFFHSGSVLDDILRLYKNAGWYIMDNIMGAGLIFMPKSNRPSAPPIGHER